MTALIVQVNAPANVWKVEASTVSGAVDETASYATSEYDAVIHYPAGGSDVTIPVLTLATVYGGSDTTWDRTDGPWLLFTVRGSDTLQVVKESDLDTVAGDYGVLARITRLNIEHDPYQLSSAATDPLQLEAGTVNVTIPSGDSLATQSVTFPVPYSSAPIVVATAYKDVYVAGIHESSITTTGFTATAATRDAATVGSDTVVPVLWHACLPTPVDCDPPTDAPTLTSPASGTGFSYGSGPTLEWDPVTLATTYQLQISENSDLSSPLFNASEDSPFDASAADYDLTTSKFYYWRVAALNECGQGPWSEIWNFEIIIF